MKSKHNAENERIKHKYFEFLKEAKRQNVSSVDSVAQAIARFEEYTKYKSFKTFRNEQAVGFKSHLSKQTNIKTGKPLSKAFLNSTLRHLKNFFQWLYMQPGYKSKINYTDTEYFNLSEKESRIANTKRQKDFPTIDQIKGVIQFMPFESATQKRNKALIAFITLTGMRDAAVASLKIKHVDFEKNCVYQDANEVKTKFSKSFTTYFFPVGDDLKAIVRQWVTYLKD